MALVIRNEDEAWSALNQALDGVLPFQHAEVVDFLNWPNLKIHLPNTPVDASITPTMMEAFIEVQTAIYRAYALVSSDTADLRTLSGEERERLEFRVVVSEGSSEYAAAFAKALEKIGVEALANMPPEYTLIAILGIALTVGSGYCFNKWMASRIESRKIEVKGEEQKALLELEHERLRAQQAGLEVGGRHAEILARALGSRLNQTHQMTAMAIAMAAA